MNISTEPLNQSDLPVLARWIGREDGSLTPNDLPSDAAALPAWFEACSEDRYRQDYLALVYETPVGVTGLFRLRDQDGTAAVRLFLGETGYNPLRTATYLMLRMLDRAFLDMSFQRVGIRVCRRHEWFLEVLEQMGFSRQAEHEQFTDLTVEKDTYLNRKYLF